MHACICLCASCGQHPACFLHLSLTHSFCLYVCESVCHRLCRVLWLLCIFSLYLFANSIPKSNCFYSKLLVANKQLIPSSCLGQCAACSIYFVHGLFRCSCFFLYIYIPNLSFAFESKLQSPRKYEPEIPLKIKWQKWYMLSSLWSYWSHIVVLLARITMQLSLKTPSGVVTTTAKKNGHKQT